MPGRLPSAKGARSVLKIISINLFIAFLLLGVVEIFFRLVRSGFGRTCWLQCDYASVLRDVGAEPRSSFQESTYVYDRRVGFVPRPLLAGMIFDSPWDNSVVSTGPLGIRNSAYDFSAAYPLGKALTVGDSFTFGSEVSDSDTWQSCLNLSQPDYLFVNAGVGGYGTAQALKRAQLLQPEIRPSLLVVSTLVGKNFQRDRLAYRFGLPMPTVIKEGSGLAYASPPSPDVAGSRFSAHGNLFSAVVANLSFLGGVIPGFYNEQKAIHARTITLQNPRAASKAEIIDWAVLNSSRLGVPVLWLLQYAEDLQSADVAEERAQIIKALKRVNLPYVDTHDALLKAQRASSSSALWKPHHTKAGNALVCRQVLDSLGAVSRPEKILPSG